MDAELDVVASFAKTLVSRLYQQSLLDKHGEELADDDLQRASLLGLFVSNWFGGSDRSNLTMKIRKVWSSSNYRKPFVCTCRTRNGVNGSSSKQNLSMAESFNFIDLCKKPLCIIKQARNSNIVSIGTLRWGVCWHRAVLMKSMLNRYITAKNEENKKPKERRPFLAFECHDLFDADKWRQQIMREIGRKVADIQNEGLVEESAPVLVTARLDAEERRNNSRLREEQDAAYRAALEADQLHLWTRNFPLALCRVCAAGEGGYWKITGSSSKIYSKDGNVGYKKPFSFYRERAGHDEKTDWIMHEYYNVDQEWCEIEDTILLALHSHKAPQVCHLLQSWKFNTFHLLLPPLSFALRLRIALGLAKGILYLHNEADPPIFHRDIKAKEHTCWTPFNAKVADFGLSRLAPVPDVEGTIPGHVSTVVKGTPISMSIR
ncbi:hypothetical protein IFM89_009119 [Coptis chinensis]|uniref:Protein kinase domain-containing protein n=1 Tax=Coptis chinensis TaxID=261450 RepID=A0A835HUS1_9MAGN|nr:hypothetical protein IFM89_009119 [Coptis chinensis]